jgi:AcrR family transcriptional regulator
MIPAPVVFRQQDLASPVGRRSRKKHETRLAIEDAALTLFADHGYDETTVEEIAERADVSTTTFFRYFRSKAEVLLSDHTEQLPALHQAILDRPAAESDLAAVRRAIQQVWVHTIDTERTALKARIVATSDAVQGRSYQRGRQWLAVTADALARRRGAIESDRRSGLAARIALGVLAGAVDDWIAGDCADDLATAVDDRFDLMLELCAEWLEPEANAAHSFARAPVV